MALLRRPSSQVSASPPSSLSNLAELNVTPLLDLAFVRLIIFMITAPFLSGTSSQAPSPIIPNTGEVLEPSRVYT
ncbi:MAG: biopolymer transporter ExbD, partial [Verrucomicrobiota bacterium]